LSTTGLGECEPQNKSELECVVKWEPVNSADSTLKYGQECENDPICKPLSIIGFANTKQGFQGVISWNNEASNVGKKLSTDIEKDEEEVGCRDPEEGIDFGDGGLLLQIVQDRILG